MLPAKGSACSTASARSPMKVALVFSAGTRRHDMMPDSSACSKEQGAASLRLRTCQLQQQASVVVCLTCRAATSAGVTPKTTNLLHVRYHYTHPPPPEV